MPSRRFMLFIFLWCAGLYGVSQTSSMQITGKDEQGVAVPSITRQSGQDPSAIDELTAYRAAVGVPWSDFKGQGTITYNYAEPVEGTATIELKGGDQSRFDTTLKGVASSYRIHGLAGQYQKADKPLQQLDARDAAVGMFPLAHLGAPAFPARSGVLKDGGAATVNGKALHLLTYQEPLPEKGTRAPGADGSWVLNLYFDPASNLLVKSAAIFRGTGAHRPHMMVATYGDYREVNGSQIPFTYSESLDGQDLWTIHFTSAETSIGLSDTDFTFPEATR